MRIVGNAYLLASFPMIALGDAYVRLGGFVLLLVGGVLVAHSLLLPWRIVRSLPASAFEPRVLEISSIGIRQATDTQSHEYKWAQFREIARDRHNWILRHRDGGRPTNIARRYFTTDQEATLESLLKDLGLFA
jgi:hypothetical protein